MSLKIFKFFTKYVGKKLSFLFKFCFLQTQPDALGLHQQSITMSYNATMGHFVTLLYLDGNVVWIISEEQNAQKIHLICVQIKKVAKMELTIVAKKIRKSVVIITDLDFALVRIQLSFLLL